MFFEDRFIQIFSTVMFFCAIIHVFFSDRFLKCAYLERRKTRRPKEHFAEVAFSFLGNIALIFGIWLIPILLVILFKQGLGKTFGFLESVDYKEPFAYFVLISIATVRPLRLLFDALIRKCSRLFKNRVIIWWGGTLLLSSILTGCFSEVAIMTLVCLYLSSTFFPLKPSKVLSYLTLALLFLSISVGTTILPLNFSFFMDLLNGNWSHLRVFQLYGWKVFIALIIVIFGAGALFKGEFTSLQRRLSLMKQKKIRITAREVWYAIVFFIASLGKENIYVLLLMLAIVIILHKYPYRKKKEEEELSLYLPLLIAFFTLTLEMHASMQKWWVIPLFKQVEGVSSYSYAFFLTGLNEHIPLEALKVILKNASESTKFFSFLGILAGGGLTIIAKSANIVGKLTFKEHFPHRAISPFIHLLFAIPLALVLSGIITLLHFLGG